MTHSGFVCRSIFSHILLTEIISFISILCLRHNAKAVYSWLLKISFAFYTKKNEESFALPSELAACTTHSKIPRSPLGWACIARYPVSKAVCCGQHICRARYCKKQLARASQEQGARRRLRHSQDCSERHRARRLRAGGACRRAKRLCSNPQSFSP